MGGDKHHDDHHGHGHDDHHGHGGGHGHDDHGHGHELKRVNYDGQAPPYVHIPLPPIGSTAHTEQIQAFDGPTPPPRTIYERFVQAMKLEIFLDADMPSMSNPGPGVKKWGSFLEYLTLPLLPAKPVGYVDPYTRPNPCPEEYWHVPYKWPRVKHVNPKIPPPVDGKYNDYYHYIAFKQWLAKERDVYVAHTNLVHEQLSRCCVREGQYNAAKNCKHIANKSFAMSRMEELNQALLYMSLTGNCAIRETPYPENFVDEKRKVYDDWLHRTRMRKPGDAY